MRVNPLPLEPGVAPVSRVQQVVRLRNRETEGANVRNDEERTWQMLMSRFDTTDAKIASVDAKLEILQHRQSQQNVAHENLRGEMKLIAHRLGSMYGVATMIASAGVAALMQWILSHVGG